MYRLIAVYLALVVMVGLGAAVASGAEASPFAAAPLALDERLTGQQALTITITDEAIEAPAQVPAGPTLLVQVNQTAQAAHFFVIRIPDDITDEAFAAGMASEETPDWFWTATVVGNGDRAAPGGGSAAALVDIVPGRYAVVDPLHPRQPATFVATGEAVPMPAVVADVRAEMFEMAFEMPTSVPTGPLVWDVENVGGALHELAVIPVPEGATAEQVLLAIGPAWEGAPIPAELGDEWADWSGLPVAGVGATSPGGRVFAQFDLAPGSYVAVCFVPDQSFTPHLMLGMTQIFTVDAA